MPYKRKRTTRKYKKKSFKKYSKSSYTSTAVGPLNLVRKLRYSDTVILNAPSLGIGVNHFFSANGMFDPDITGTGHQPLGFDQYMLMYDHYKVLGSKITITPLGNPATLTADNQQIITLSLDDDTTANTNVHNMIEQGLATWRLLNPGASARPTSLRKGFGQKRFFQNRKSAESMVGDASANPTEQAFFNIGTAALNGVGDPVSIAVHVVIDYIVSFTERKTLISS